MNVEFDDDRLLECYQSRSRASRVGPVVGRAYLRAVERLLPAKSMPELGSFSGLRVHPRIERIDHDGRTRGGLGRFRRAAASGRVTSPDAFRQP